MYQRRGAAQALSWRRAATRAPAIGWARCVIACHPAPWGACQPAGVRHPQAVGGRGMLTTTTGTRHVTMPQAAGAGAGARRRDQQTAVAWCRGAVARTQAGTSRGEHVAGRRRQAPTSTAANRSERRRPETVLLGVAGIARQTAAAAAKLLSPDFQRGAGGGRGNPAARAAAASTSTKPPSAGRPASADARCAMSRFASPASGPTIACPLPATACSAASVPAARSTATVLHGRGLRGYVYMWVCVCVLGGSGGWGKAS